MKNGVFLWSAAVLLCFVVAVIFLCHKTGRHCGGHRFMDYENADSSNISFEVDNDTLLQINWYRGDSSRNIFKGRVKKRVKVEEIAEPVKYLEL